MHCEGMAWHATVRSEKNVPGSTCVYCNKDRPPRHGLVNGSREKERKNRRRRRLAARWVKCRSGVGEQDGQHKRPTEAGKVIIDPGKRRERRDYAVASISTSDTNRVVVGDTNPNGQIAGSHVPRGPLNFAPAGKYLKSRENEGINARRGLRRGPLPCVAGRALDRGPTAPRTSERGESQPHGKRREKKRPPRPVLVLIPVTRIAGSLARPPSPIEFRVSREISKYLKLHARIDNINLERTEILTCRACTLVEFNPHKMNLRTEERRPRPLRIAPLPREVKAELEH
ncbi:hypothetical protein FB451DRAFT_1358954 [Mycena latifolia]|nr:hypothetical protein FB451DRAFT_1358954 [Mycena latifolia]